MTPSTDQKLTMMDENGEGNGSNQHETDVLLATASPPPPVTETLIDMPDDNPNENELAKTCRFCGEGDQEEEEDIDNVTADGYTERHPMNLHYCTKTNNNNNNNNNPLIRPCKCKGSMMYVHVDCLNQWRSMSPRQESYFACDLCGYQYDLRRPVYADIVTHSYFIHTTTVVSVLTLALVMAYLAKVFHVFVFNQQPMPDDTDWIQWHGCTILWMDRVYLAVGVVCVSALGILYMLYLSLVVSASSSSAAVETPLPWLVCCDQSGCSWYGCYLADAAACNGDAALGGLIILVGFLIMMVIAFGIAGATIGVYTAVESGVKRIAGQVKERILDVTLS